MRRWPFLRSLRPGQIRADETEEIREELELYLDLRTEELVREGLDAVQARAVAESRFGNTQQVEDELKRQAKRRRAKVGRVMTMGGFKQDLAFAVRTFRRNPGFTVVDSGFCAFDDGVALGCFALASEESGADGVAGIGLVGLGGDDIAGFGLDEMVMYWEIQLTPSCGDGNQDAGEACDDGNVDNGDGCSSTCTLEDVLFGDADSDGDVDLRDMAMILNNMTGPTAP